MTTIESKKVVVAAPAANVHDFLINTDNIQQLLPEGKITEWKSDGKMCSFKIQGAYTIGLRLISSTPNTSVVYESTEGSPFTFNLNVHINETAASSDAHLVCEANINPFLEMMVKGPLKNLFDYMADKLVTRVN
jgi:carbon monoxide dehydrogenase subunit G